MDKVLATKLLAPRTGVNLIQRSRLLHLFEGYEARKLTLISAPAGYGKTVLVSQFAGMVEQPVVWYQLDSFDNDLAAFIQYLVSGIRKHISGFGAEALDMIGKKEDLSKQTRMLVTTLVNELAARLVDKLILVLDDYHLIQEPAVHKTIEEFLEYLPEGVHLVITSRTVPGIPLSRLKVSGMMIEIQQEDLKFNRNEIADFLVAGSNELFTDESINALEKETGGWPAALRLIGSSLSGVKPKKKDFVVQAIKSRREIYDYLAAEVLDNLPASLQSFLLATSVLDVLTPEICDLILERQDSRQVLENLEEQNLFTFTLEGEEEAYRYHNLFQLFLQTQLGDKRLALFRRAGECYYQLGFSERAVNYFIEAGDYHQAIQAMEKAGVKALRLGRWQTVSRWVGSLPEELSRNRPWILFLAGAVAACQGRLQEAEILIQQANQVFQAASDQEGISQSLIYKARLLRSRGDYAESLKLLETVLPHLLHRPVADWFDVSLEKSMVLGLQGNFDRAIKVLKIAFAAAEREGESRIAAQLGEKLGEQYYAKGDYAKAMEIHQRAVEMDPEPERAAYSSRDSIAMIYRDWGDLDLALEYAQKSVETKERFGLVEALPYAYHQLAVILADLGKIDESESNFRLAIQLARESGGEFFFQALSKALLGRLLAVEQDRLEEGCALVDEAVLMAKGQSNFIYGICLEVAAQAYVIAGKPWEGNEMLRQAVEILEPMGAKYLLCISYGIMAKACLSQDDVNEGLKHVIRCLELAAAENYMQMFLSNRKLLLPVARIALEHGIETAFIYELLKRLGSEAVELLVELVAHHDPAVRRRVIQPLVQEGGEKAKQAIVSLLKDSDEDVRDYALAAFQAIKGNGGSGRTAPQESQANRQAATGSTPTNLVRLPGTTATGDGAPLIIQCFGPFRAFAGGEEPEELSWRTLKARDLFAFLIHHREIPVSKEKILEGIWPDVDPEQASTLFHTNLYQLRKAVRTACGNKKPVGHMSGQYQLARELVACDVVRFEKLTGKPPAESPAEEITRLEEAVALYRGEYLEGLDYDWVTGERERLGRIYLSIMERLANLCLDAGEYSRAGSYLRAILRLNPLLEEVHGLLMTAYACLGDRMAVIQQYETLSQVLENELGIDPSPKTRDLFYKLCGEKN